MVRFFSLPGLAPFKSNNKSPVERRQHMALRSLTSSEGQRVLHDQEASGRSGQGPQLGKENTNNTAAQNSDPLPQSGAACKTLVDQGQVLQQAPVLGSEAALRDAKVARCIAYHKDEQARSTSGG